MSDNQKIIDNFEGTEIAVVGLALRVPGAANSDEYWQNLKNGVESLNFYTDDELREAGVSEAEINNPNYVKAGAPLDNMEMFDAGFFGFSPRDAAIMDPQHRHFLEVCWEALEHAGYDPEQYEGAIGVFGGSGHNAYMPYNLLTNPSLLDSVGFFLLRHTSNDKDFLTTRVSYLFNLSGPSINLQTACSTSLVAIHLGSQSLLSGECDMAIAGGVTFDLPHRQGYMYKEGEIVSPDGHCRAFDADAQGTRFGSGAGAVILKRLADAIEDGDTIHAVVKGSAINNDGSGKVNYLAPSVDGQASAIAEAIALADVDPETIGYIETHGTGTSIGDPIEVAALTNAFRVSTDKTQFCGLGSVKTNIGHLDTAAGVAGFIKTVLALKHQQIPPSLNYKAPNPQIDFANSPFYVNAKLRDWPVLQDAPRRGAVSSLGVGGTNAHVILEESPVLEASSPSRPCQLLTLSAKTPTALEQASDNLAAFLQENPEVPLADVAYTLQRGRQPMKHRRTVVCQTPAEGAEFLQSHVANQMHTAVSAESPPSVVFMFSGQGSQYVNMGRDLYASEPIFQEEVDRCAAILQPQLGFDLREVLYPADGDEETAAERLKQTAVTQPALFTIEYATAKLWLSWGVQPWALIGHSIGEYVAACLSGVFSLEDALAIVAERGRLMQSLPAGTMMVVQMGEETVRPYLNGTVSLAAINAESLTVLSGEDAAMTALQQKFEQDEIPYRKLHTSHAFHSAMMEPILAPFASTVAQKTRQAPQIPFVSNVTGNWISEAEATSPDYWASHIRQGVRFADGLDTLLSQQDNLILLEVGPGTTLSTFAGQHSNKGAGHTVITSLRHPKEQTDDQAFLLKALGQIWAANGKIDWSGFYADELRYRVPLPTYPFEHQRYWIEPGQQQFQDSSIERSMAKKEDMADWFYQPIWHQKPLPRLATESDEPKRWLLFADEQDVASRLQTELIGTDHPVISVRQGAAFAQLSDSEFEIRPNESDDYARLLEQLDKSELLPTDVVHLWSVTEAANGSYLATLSQDETNSFYSLLYLAQALGQLDKSESVNLTIVSNNMQMIGAETSHQPTKSLLLGPCRVIPNEFPFINCRSLDVALPQTGTWQARQFTSQLVTELLSPPSDLIVAHRGNGRWVQSFESTVPEQEADPQPQIRPEGVYLITGGLGALGLAAARYLAESAQAKLVLLARSAVPDRADWPAWLETHSPHNKTSQRIQQLLELEDTGAELLILSADVADKEEMKQVVAEAVDRFGTIHGVLHTAGVLEDGIMQMKTAESAANVLRPKVTGALVLDDVLAEIPLDFCIYYSSVSALTGLAGQVDYAAANAFLDALAWEKMQRDGRLTVAVNWGAWSEIGMTANLAQLLGLVEPEGVPISYPFFDQWRDLPEEHLFTQPFSIADHWLLAEHRLQGGDALIPGTGYLELVRAGLQQTRLNQATGVELREVFFMAPFMVADGESKTLRLGLSKDIDGSFVIKSRLSEESENWLEHVRGQATAVPSQSRQIDLQAIQARCQEKIDSFTENNHEQLAFGPRWNNMRQIAYGQDEVLVTLCLPDAFTADLAEFHLHPAMLDMATAGGQGLIRNFDAAKDFFVPFSYGRLHLHAPLPQQVYSHIVYRSEPNGDSETAVFDVTIMDQSGQVLVEIENFVMRRVEKASLGATTAEPATAAANNQPATVASPLAQTIAAGITPEEGAKALEQILTGSIWPQVIVVSQDLQGLIEQARQNATAGEDEAESAGVTFARPNLSTPFVEPSTPLETDIAKIWQDLLGIDAVGIEDDFFELGGHSLLLTQAVTRVRKLSKANVSLMKLFEASTITDMVAELNKSAESGVVLPEAPALKRVSRDAYRRKRPTTPAKPSNGTAVLEKVK